MNSAISCVTMPQTYWVCSHCQKSFSCLNEADIKYHNKLCPDVLALKLKIRTLENTKSVVDQSKSNIRRLENTRSVVDSKISANSRELSLLELKAELKDKTERINQEFEYAYRRAKHEAKKERDAKSQLARKRKSPSCKQADNNNSTTRAAKK